MLGGLAFAFRSQLDISVYLNAASHLFNSRLYEISLPQRPHLPFTYPPFAAVAFYPLSLIPPKTAQLLWSLVNVAALYSLLYLSIRAALPALRRRMLVLLSLILMAPAFLLDPVRQTFSFGQVNLVLAAFVLFDITGQLKIGEKALPRGVLIGIASAIKLTPLIFVPYLLVTRRARAAWVALATFVLASAAASALSPSASWSYWTKYATDAQRMGGVYYISNQSLRAVADRVDHAVVPTVLVTVISAVILIGGIWVAAWAFRASSDLLGVLACATTGLLVSPVTWDHHLVWVVPVIIWLACAPDRPKFGRAWAIGAAALFWWAPVWSVPHGNNMELSENAWQLLGGNSFFIPMVAFVGGAAAMLTLRRRRSQRGEPREAQVTVADQQDVACAVGSTPATGSEKGP